MNKRHEMEMEAIKEHKLEESENEKFRNMNRNYRSKFH